MNASFLPNRPPLAASPQPAKAALAPKPVPTDPPWDDPKNWVPLKEAAHLLHVSRRTIVRMCEAINPNTGRAYLRFWRPTPGTMMICQQSLQEFCRITQNDPEFWQRREKETKPLSVGRVKRSRRR